jgi:phosphatidylethanolamine-binding protein (PEBP) family uncharacterized protein
MPLLLASPAIPPGGEIPSQYTCNGAGISPPLTWSGLQDGTESLVLFVEYPSAGGFHKAPNDLRKEGYGGPCPRKGHGSHHYHLRLLAISQPTVDLKPTATAADVLRTTQLYAIQRAELVGITGIAEPRLLTPCPIRR